MKIISLHHCLHHKNFPKTMDVELITELLSKITEEGLKLKEEFRAITDDYGHVYYFRFIRLIHFLGPILTAVLAYYYFKYLLVLNASQYEEYVKRRYGHVKRVSRQLKNLAKRYGHFYFCYMPMSHGTVLPRPHSLFVAIKEVLTNSNRPATRILRMNFLKNLLWGELQGRNMNLMYDHETEIFAERNCDLDPLSEFNLDIMKCCRELIIQGVKDFDVMSTVYRVVETVMDDAE